MTGFQVTRKQRSSSLSNVRDEQGKFRVAGKIDTNNPIVSPKPETPNEEVETILVSNPFFKYTKDLLDYVKTNDPNDKDAKPVNLDRLRDCVVQMAEENGRLFDHNKGLFHDNLAFFQENGRLWHDNADFLREIGRLWDDNCRMSQQLQQADSNNTQFFQGLLNSQPAGLLPAPEPSTGSNTPSILEPQKPHTTSIATQTTDEKEEKSVKEQITPQTASVSIQANLPDPETQALKDKIKVLEVEKDVTVISIATQTTDEKEEKSVKEQITPQTASVSIQANLPDPETQALRDKIKVLEVEKDVAVISIATQTTDEKEEKSVKEQITPETVSVSIQANLPELEMQRLKDKIKALEVERDMAVAKQKQAEAQQQEAKNTSQNQPLLLGSLWGMFSKVYKKNTDEDGNLKDANGLQELNRKIDTILSDAQKRYEPLKGVKFAEGESDIGKLYRLVQVLCRKANDTDAAIHQTESYKALVEVTSTLFKKSIEHVDPSYKPASSEDSVQQLVQILQDVDAGKVKLPASFLNPEHA